MAFDFEALVGHLYVVGGRSINAQPPGMLVEVAPRRSARGRELDTLFVLVLPSGDVMAPAAFYEQMASLAAERYFDIAGSVTAALRELFSSFNEDLIRHNTTSQRQYEANLLCAVLREQELYVARAGSGVAVYRHAGAVSTFPPDLTSDEALFGPPLGVHPVPDMKMTRYAVAEGSRLLLADARLADMHREQMEAALYSSDISEVLNGLREAAPKQIALLAAEFVTPEAPSPAAVKAAVTSSRPVVAPPVPAVTTTGELPVVPAPVPAEEAKPKPPSVLAVALRRLGAGLALTGGRGLRLFSGTLDRWLPPPQGGRSWLSASGATAIAVIIPILIVAVVLLLGIGRAGESQFEVCVEQAQETAAVARSIDTGDRNGTLAAWNAVITAIDECNDLRTGDPTLAALTREAQSVIDVLFVVQRRDTGLIQSFPNAELTRIIQQGLDLYILDGRNQLVYRVTLSGDGRSAVPGATQAISAMRFGAVVGDRRVDNLIDLVWLPDSTQVAALDRTGLLIECSPRFLQDCQWQRLLGAERWVAPTHILYWQGRLYLLDPGANQIWRYDATGGTFASIPIEYFSGASRPDIRTSVGFGIDDRGSVYVLLANGEMTKWVSGGQTPFTYANFPEGQALTSVDSLYLNADPLGQGLYVVSRQRRTVYEMSLAGTFYNSFRSFDEDLFAGLTSVVSDVNQQVVYALSGNSIFAFEKQTLPQ